MKPAPMTLRPLLWAGLLLAAVGSSILVWTLRPVAMPVSEPAARSDYILRDFELVMLGEDGLESFTVTGPYLQREPDGKSLTLTEPRFAFPDPHQGRWRAEARRAWVGPKAQEVRLLDAVQFLGPASTQGQRTRFESERLDIFPNENRASTELAVTVSQGGSILRGTALRADMAAQRYQLSQVQGSYAPYHR